MSNTLNYCYFTSTELNGLASKKWRDSPLPPHL